MQQGMLYIEDDGQLALYEHKTSRRLAMIEPGSKLEIQLGNCWIVGVFRPDYNDDSHMEEPYHLMVEPGTSFCGIVSGMVGRIAG